MAISKSSARQYPLVAVQEFGFADFAGQSGVALDAVEVPAGSTILSGFVEVTVAFNSGTSDSLDVAGGGGSAAAVNGQTVADTALAVTNVENAATTQVTVEWTGVGGVPTAGAGRLVVEYVVGDRDNENQGL